MEGGKMQAKKQIPYTTRAELISYLKKLASDYRDIFNRSNPENKSAKWRLLRLEKALELVLADSDYTPGKCIQCQDDIPIARQKAEPQSVWCVACVNKHEKATRHKGGHWYYGFLNKEVNNLAEKRRDTSEIPCFPERAQD